MPSSLASKWVLITGASSGFGAAAARAFAREGAKLLLGARRLDRLEAVAAECNKLGAPDAQFAALDVASTASVNTFVEWARSHTDKLDVLINNAGGAKGLETVADGKDEDWEFMIRLPASGQHRGTSVAPAAGRENRIPVVACSGHCPATLRIPESRQ